MLRQFAMDEKFDALLGMAELLHLLRELNRKIFSFPQNNFMSKITENILHNNVQGLNSTIYVPKHSGVRL